MNIFSKITRALAICGALTFTLFTSSSRAESVQGQAEVISVSGDATFTEPGSKPLPVLKGMIFHNGAVIVTGSGAKVELYLGANGNKVMVKEKTTLEINKLELDKSGDKSTTELNLKQGSLYGNVKKVSSASTFKVTYAKGVAGIRGTEWAILPDGTVVCTSGSVEVTFVGPNGTPITVTLDASNGPVQLPPGSTTPGKYTGPKLDGGNQATLVLYTPTTDAHPSAVTGVITVRAVQQHEY
jgi:hypothetical protein